MRMRNRQSNFFIKFQRGEKGNSLNKLHQSVDDGEPLARVPHTKKDPPDCFVFPPEPWKFQDFRSLRGATKGAAV